MAKVSKAVAHSELLELLESMSIETQDLTEEDQAELDQKIKILLRPLISGKAVIDGDSYVLTLKQPIGDTKTVTIKEPNGRAWEVMGAAGKNQTKAVLMFLAATCGITYAELCKMMNSDIKILKEFGELFMA